MSKNPDATLNAVPAGYLQTADPYFAPPVNLPPLPVGYTSSGTPYFARQLSVNTSILASAKTLRLAGFDHKGNPFFLPANSKLPTAKGFTLDGIPYYDIYTIVNNKRSLFLPLSVLSQFTPLSMTTVETPVKHYLSANELHDLTSFESTLFDKIPKNSSRAQSMDELASELNMENIDIQTFMKKSTEATAVHNYNVRFSFDPNEVNFQSLNSIIAKKIMVKYRFARGDLTTCRIYIATDPIDIFEVTNSIFDIKGEGFLETTVKFDPTRMKTEEKKGSLNIIDSRGVKLATLPMSAERKSFITVSKTQLDFGWLLPGSKCTLELEIENKSESMANLKIFLKGNNPKKGDAPEEPPAQAQAPGSVRRPFICHDSSLRMNSNERKIIPLTFDPPAVGHFSDSLDIHGPSGEIIQVTLEGISGTPLVVYPEPLTATSSTTAAIAKERCHTIKKIFQKESGEQNDLVLTDEEQEIHNYITSFITELCSKSGNYCVDFGFFADTTEVKNRYITLFNLSNTPITLALAPRDDVLTCPYLVRVAPKTGFTVSVSLKKMKGVDNFKSLLDVICPELQTISVSIKAYFGNPLYFLTTDTAFFKTTACGKSEDLEFSVVNKSHYPVNFVMEFLEYGETDQFSSTKHCMLAGESSINASTLGKYQVTFKPTATGAYLYLSRIRILGAETPIYTDLTSTGPLKLAGISINPRKFAKSAEFIETLKAWMIQPSKLTELYPGPPGRIIDEEEFLNAPEVAFEHRVLVFKTANPNETITSRIGQLISHNMSNSAKVLKYLTSTCFSSEPRDTRLDNKRVAVITMFYQNIPSSYNGVYMYGSVFGLQQDNFNFDSAQIIGKLGGDIIIHPMADTNKRVIMDFGVYEYQGKNASQEGSIKNLMLYNTSDSTYSWSVNITGNKKKWSAFVAPIASGIIRPRDSFAIPLKFFTDMAGFYEHKIDFSYMNVDIGGFNELLCHVHMKGQCVVNTLQVVPDYLDFGTIVASLSGSRSIRLTNTGSKACTYHFVAKSPFATNINSVTLEAGKWKEVIVTFSPTKSCNLTSKLLIFSDSRLLQIPLIGRAGTLLLEADSLYQKGIDFGLQPENTITWIPVYLTNNGSLPLNITGIISRTPNIIRCHYVDVISTIPNENDRPKIEIQKDGWRFVKSRLSAIIRNGRTIQESAIVKHKGSVIRSTSSKGKRAGASASLSVVKSAKDLRDPYTTPVLHSFHSYLIKVGYVSRNPVPKDVTIRIIYGPQHDSLSGGSTVHEELVIPVFGDVFRPISVTPVYCDFNICPVYVKTGSARSIDHLNVNKKTFSTAATKSLMVSNLSKEYQNLILESINTPFSIKAKQWNLSPGKIPNHVRN